MEKKSSHAVRLNFGTFVDKAFWALIVVVLTYASQQLHAVGELVASVDKRVAVIESDRSYELKRVDSLEARLSDTEKTLQRIEAVLSSVFSH